MWVCCVVFDIDGMLFEFCMNFLNIEKKISSIFQVFFTFHAISNIKKKIGLQKKISGGGGGCGFFIFFVEKQLFLISRFMLFSTLDKYWKVPLHLLIKWKVVSPNSREGHLESIYIISSIPLFWFCISNVGGGGCNVFLTFFAISNISRKQNLAMQNNYFSFNVFFMFFFVCWKYCNVPLHLQLLVKWEVVSPDIRYREFYHEIGGVDRKGWVPVPHPGYHY